ncbi:MAG: penicillin-binding protein activator LpoB [Holophagaceae bacterium]|nr:penicillin-binding protein activator LpoB [Holophagaceae bacterium]
MRTPFTFIKAIALVFACLFCGSLVAQGKKAVAVLEPAGNATVSNINKASARGTLEDFLSRSRDYKVVDRANTDKVFQELGFQRTSGMVSDDDVKKIGKMVGADSVCVSEILKEGGEANVTVSLIHVETGQKDTRSGFIEDDSSRAINDLIVNLASRLTDVATPGGMLGSRQPASATPASTPAAPAPQSVGLQDPRIAVIIPEFHITARIPDPAGETAVIRKFLEAGYTRMVDPNSVKSIRESDKVKALMSGDIEVAKALSVQLGVDYIVVGEAFSEAVGRVAGNMFSCRARVEARLIRTDTAQIIATHGFHAGGADLVEFNSAKVALTRAGELMGDYMVQQLRNRGGSSKTEINLTVAGVTSFAKLRELEQALKGIKEINAVYIRENAMGVARIDLDASVTAQALASIIEAIRSPRLQITETSGSAIKVSLR